MEEASRTQREGTIWTPDQRVRVFVSSTLTELAAERTAARAAIAALHLTPVLFELGARPHPPRTLYAAYMDQSDVFVGIYWQRYGWVAPGTTLSGLEDEYDLSSRLPRLLYVKEPAPDRETELARLLARFENDASASYRKFTQPDELGQLIGDDLAILLSERFGKSPRADSPYTHPPVLPALLTPTIGRRKEIAAVGRLLRRGTRLVTVTGAAGVGKSRIAAEVAREQAAEQRGDVWFVSLTSLTDPAHLTATIAEEVGVRRDVPDPLDALSDRFAERPTLLVLDNFEHLATAAADVVSLLDRCEHLQVLVTSRHLLRIRGEHEYPLAPLGVPSPTAPNIRKASAVKLFVDRAAAARPGFALTPRNEEAIAAICRRLDGLPLALELAAARVRVLEPDELLDRLGARLDLLGDGGPDLPEHQRTLRTALDWSYNLLTPEEQALFARLSVFPGGATLAAAEAVCGDERLTDVLEVMASLLEKSLVVHVIPARGQPRFEMLHVVRSFAWERLVDRAEIDLMQGRHMGWFLGSLRRWGIACSADDRWDLLESEIDNVRSVVGWALDNEDLPALATLARDLRSPWWRMRGLAWEALAWLQRADAMADRTAPVSVEKAWISVALAHVLDQAGRGAEAEHSAQAALELFISFGEQDGIAAGRLTLAAALGDQGRTAEAIALAQEVLDQARRAGQDGVILVAASILGACLIAQRDLDAARTAQQIAQEAAARIGAQLYLATAHHQLAVIELMADHLADCWSELNMVATIYSRMGHCEGIGYSLEMAAMACLAEHEIEEAAEAMDLAQRLHDDNRLPMWPVLRPWHDRLVAELRAATATAKRRPRASSVGAVQALQRICERHVRHEAEQLVEV